MAKGCPHFNNTFHFSHLICKVTNHFHSIEKISRRVKNVITIKQYSNRRVSEDEGHLIGKEEDTKEDNS